MNSIEEEIKKYLPSSIVCEIFILNQGISDHRLQLAKNFALRYQNLLMIFGLIISFSGGSWDITYHILSKPESFFSYPHTMVYSGILLVIGIFFLNFKKNFNETSIIKRSYRIVLAGVILIVVAGPFDFLWHLRFGLDGLLSPPHLSLLTGWLLVALGNLKITNFRFELANPKNIKDKPSSNLGYHPTASNHPDASNNGKYWRFFSPVYHFKHPYGFLLAVQVLLNLFILLMIFSGFLYFFSLPFSETNSYNFNPPSLIGLLVYGIGFPTLFTFYFFYIYSKYQLFYQFIPLVGIFYVLITLFTQITSNSYLYHLSGFFLLNAIPFLMFYLLTIKESSILVFGTYKKKNSNSNSSSIVYLKLSKIFLIFIFPILTYTLCFPLNVYIYNEEFYGYLIYQNVVWSVYQQIIDDFFVIVIPLSIAGGIFGFVAFKILNKIVKIDKI